MRRLGAAEEARREQTGAGLRDEAQIDEGHPEPRARRGIDEIAMEQHRRSDSHRVALDRLTASDSAIIDDDDIVQQPETIVETRLNVHDLRLDRVADVIRASGATSVADLGCGVGKLLRRLIRNGALTKILGVDVSTQSLRRAAENIKLAQPGGPKEGRVTLMQGALTYRDARWMGTDATVEPRLGGLYLVNVTGRRTAEGRFTEVIPVHRLAYSFGWQERDDVPPESTMIEIDLIEREGGTLLRLTHSGLPTPAQCAAHEEGWAHYLARLAVAAGGGDPGPDRFRNA